MRLKDLTAGQDYAVSRGKWMPPVRATFTGDYAEPTWRRQARVAIMTVADSDCRYVETEEVAEMMVANPRPIYRTRVPVGTSFRVEATAARYEDMGEGFGSTNMGRRYKVTVDTLHYVEVLPQAILRPWEDHVDAEAGVEVYWANRRVTELLYCAGKDLLKGSIMAQAEGMAAKVRETLRVEAKADLDWIRVDNGTEYGALCPVPTVAITADKEAVARLCR